MAKYSYELKKKIVEEYLSGEGGFAYLVKKHGVNEISSLPCKSKPEQQYLAPLHYARTVCVQNAFDFQNKF